MSATGGARHVVIVGGVFAGVACAKRLGRRGDVRVTLLDRNNYQQFQPLLSRTVTTSGGRTFTGDALVVAAGAVSNFFGVAGAADHALPLYSLADALRLNSRIIGIFEDVDADPRLLDQGALNFVVVGAGATGTEVAGALADMLRGTMRIEYADLPVATARVHLVDRGDAVLAPFSTRAQAYAARKLREKGVELHLGVGVQEVAADHVALSDGTVIATRCAIWGGGIKAAPLAVDGGLPEGHGGRVDVRPDLTIEGAPGVFVVGDVANIPGPDGRALPQLGSVAQQSGAWAADGVLAQFDGRAPVPFRYRDKGIMAMIGVGAAVAAVGPRRREIDGPVAFLAWLAVHAMLLDGMRARAEASVAWTWDYLSRARGPQLLDRRAGSDLTWNTPEPQAASAAPKERT